jgi:putative inorganic carbon (hco3(-)) transporter
MGLALVIAYIALNLLSPADMFPSLSAYRPMIVLGVVSLAAAMLERLQTPEVGKLRTQFILVALFLGWATCSWLPHGKLGGGINTFIEMAPNILVYFLGIVAFRSASRLSMVRIAMVAVAVFVMANALWELPFVLSGGGETPYVMVFNATVYQLDPRIHGLGMLSDPNTFGQYLLQVLPLLFVSQRKTGLGVAYVVVLPLAALFLVGVYMTGSRGALMGFAVLLGLFLTRRFKTTGAVLSAVVGALILLGVNAYKSRAISMSGGMDRLSIWSDGLSYFKHSPLWGIGVGSFMRTRGMTAHNSYLLCAAELGMIGFFLWMSTMVVTMIQLNRAAALMSQTNPALSRWAVALRLSLGVYLFTSFFLSRAYDLPLFLLLGMSGGVVVAAGGDAAIPLRGTYWPVWAMSLCVGIIGLIYLLLRLRAV